MDFIKQTQKLAATLSQQFDCEEMNLTVQMRQGEDWITLDMYRNAEEPHKFYATFDFDTRPQMQLNADKTIH